MRFTGLVYLTALLSACSVVSAKLTAQQIASNLYLVTNIIQGTGYRIEHLSPEVIVNDGPASSFNTPPKHSRTTQSLIMSYLDGSQWPAGDR